MTDIAENQQPLKWAYVPLELVKEIWALQPARLVFKSWTMPQITGTFIDMCADGGVLHGAMPAPAQPLDEVVVVALVQGPVAGLAVFRRLQDSTYDSPQITISVGTGTDSAAGYRLECTYTGKAVQKELAYLNDQG